MPSNATGEPTLSNDDLIAWLGILRRDSPEIISAAKLQIPATTNLPTPTEFAAAVDVESEASTAVARIDQIRLRPAYAPIYAQDGETRAALRAELERIEKLRLALERVECDWLQMALKDSIAGRSARWRTLLELNQGRLSSIETFLSRLGDRSVTIPDHFDHRKVKSDAAATLTYFRDGGKWKHFILLTPKILKGRTYLKQEVLVDGEAAQDTEALQAVCDHLDIEFAYSDLEPAWEDVGAPPITAGDGRMRLALMRERTQNLKRLADYAASCQQVAPLMVSATRPIPEPNWLNGETQHWVQLIDAASIEDRLSQATSTVNAYNATLTPLRKLHDAHPLVESLIGSVEKRDITAYSEGYANLGLIERTRTDQRERARIEGVLDETVPGLVGSVTSDLDNELWNTRLDAWRSAWNWSVADACLEKRSDFEYQKELWSERHIVDEQIGKLIGEAAALRAWVHFFNRLSRKESAALKSWREAVRAMGKGTGRSAKMARLRREARQYMDSCRDAIPAWIMPRYLVAEMVDPAPGRYDLVIVDEASQLGIQSLFLFYIAKKLVVVGDDQQISPYGVGIADAAIASLQKHYLDGIPHQHALSAQSSFYGNAKIRYSNPIVLREHFRCMPEIIQFSNDLCYASNGTPLDPLRAYPANRLQPLVLRHVPDGYRIGGSQNAQNPAEADAIVAQIAACVEDPRYRKATMGVISLQGEAQAKLIERQLLEALDPEVIEERRLICGDAYAFQGDERNVIFLSMVAAPGKTRIGALTNESARQRFNVAVSRAQDQLWLFHTAQIDVLSDACMRYRLLSYMLDPFRQTTKESQQRFDSDFERHVYRRITGKGFHVRTQVCVGDPTNHRYRIDIVVEGMQGRLAVECDGDRWHGPDRYEQDMARQRDLERAGWQFARIRGGNFYRNQEKAMEPVWEELDRLGIRPGGIDASAAEPPLPKLMDPDQPAGTALEEASADKPSSPESVEASSTGTQPPEECDSKTPTGYSPQPTTPHTPAHSKQESEQTLDATSLPPLTNSTPVTPPSAGVAPYIAFEGPAGPDPRDCRIKKVAEGLCLVIDTEGPMLAKRAYVLYLRSSGIRRMGRELKKSMNKALELAIRDGRVVNEDETGAGDLLYSIVRPAGVPAVLLRERGPRDFEEIPPSELQLVARRLLRNEGFQSGSDAHLRAVLDFYDLKRLTVQVGTKLLDILGRHYPYVDDILN